MMSEISLEVLNIWLIIVCLLELSNSLLILAWWCRGGKSINLCWNVIILIQYWWCNSLSRLWLKDMRSQWRWPHYLRKLWNIINWVYLVENILRNTKLFHVRFEIKELLRANYLCLRKSWMLVMAKSNFILK